MITLRHFGWNYLKYKWLKAQKLLNQDKGHMYTRTKPFAMLGYDTKLTTWTLLY